MRNVLITVSSFISHSFMFRSPFTPLPAIPGREANLLIFERQDLYNGEQAPRRGAQGPGC